MAYSGIQNRKKGLWNWRDCRSSSSLSSRRYLLTRTSTSSTYYENAAITRKVSKRFTPLYLPTYVATQYVYASPTRKQDSRSSPTTSYMYMYEKTGLTIIFVGTYLLATTSKKKKRKREKGKLKRNKKDKADVPREVYIYTYLHTYLPKASNKPP